MDASFADTYADTTADIEYLFHICSITMQCFLGSAYIDFCHSGGSAEVPTHCNAFWDQRISISALWRISICSIALQCFLGSAYIDFCRSGGSAYIDFYRSGIFFRHTAQHSPMVLLSAYLY